ncbi:hypothetical protein [Streptosporangium sp. NPDC049078]|uniref:hypothetical protein n=1 Tax=Streptosporangium sp. NPDC049078 TaxID=3155767 RepID=UPI00343AA83F
MNDLIIATLLLAGVGLDIARQVLVAIGELEPDPAVEAALRTRLRSADRIPVADALERIRHRTARRSRRRTP